VVLWRGFEQYNKLEYLYNASHWVGINVCIVSEINKDTKLSLTLPQAAKMAGSFITAFIGISTTTVLILVWFGVLVPPSKAGATDYVTKQYVYDNYVTKERMNELIRDIKENQKFMMDEVKDVKTDVKELLKRTK
jgi:hypothetical protein